MARKILNRKELRAENDAAEAAGEGGKKAKEKKAPAKRKSRSKTAKEVRLKAFWTVYTQSMKPVAKFEYNERKQADKKAAELSANGKSPHFVQILKEVIEE
jgi:hypothetical protein